MRQHYPVLLPFLALENLVLKCGAVSYHGKISCIEVQNAARLSPCEALDKDTGNFTVRNQDFLISPQPLFDRAFIFPAVFSALAEVGYGVLQNLLPEIKNSNFSS